MAPTFEWVLGFGDTELRSLETTHNAGVILVREGRGGQVIGVFCCMDGMEGKGEACIVGVSDLFPTYWGPCVFV